MDKRQLIFTGKICPYCGKEAELIDSAEVYHGVSYGWMYICRPCDAYVGCYKGTKKALGRLANAELRKYKHEVHDVFDLIWKKHFMKRAQAYTWLSKQLGTERDYTHIGMFDVETCKKVIAVSNKYLIERGSTNKYNSNKQQHKQRKRYNYMTKKKTDKDNGIILPDMNNNPVAHKEEFETVFSIIAAYYREPRMPSECLKPTEMIQKVRFPLKNSIILNLPIII